MWRLLHCRANSVTFCRYENERTVTNTKWKLFVRFLLPSSRALSLSFSLALLLNSLNRRAFRHLSSCSENDYERPIIQSSGGLLNCTVGEYDKSNTNSIY